MSTPVEVAGRLVVKRLALLCGVLLLIVVVASAWMRLSGAGLGCADWPACYGHPGVTSMAGTVLGVEGVRLVHRIAATAALLITIAMVWLCWRRRPALRAEGQIAYRLLIIMLGLSLLGWFVGSATLPVVVLMNLLGGFAMLALVWRLYVVAASDAANDAANDAASSAATTSHRLGWLRLGAVLLLAEIVLGALISADFAGLACTTLPNCGGIWWPSGEWGYAFNPLRDFAGRPLGAGEAGGVALHMLHRALALTSALVLGVASLRVAARAGMLGIAVPALLLVEIVLGLASVRFGLNLWLVVAHNLVAALLFAATIVLLRRLAQTR